MLYRLRTCRPLGYITPCQPAAAHKPPSGPGWIHEVKHDGYPLMARRDGASIRLLTRNGNNWSELFPALDPLLTGRGVSDAR
jgi:bifunctional non-homologous end joining protein LigD